MNRPSGSVLRVEPTQLRVPTTHIPVRSSGVPLEGVPCREVECALLMPRVLRVAAEIREHSCGYVPYLTGTHPEERQYNVKNQGFAVVARRAVSFTATMFMVAVGAAGCGVEQSGAEQQADTNQVNEMVNCCYFGYFKCSSDGVYYEYVPATCGGATSTQALAMCQSECSGTCSGSGWLDGCRQAE